MGVLAAWVAPAPAAAQAIVALSFDDTIAEHQDAAELLQAADLRGTFYVNSSRLDRPGYLTTTQVLTLAAAGHEIGGHSLGHRRLTELDSEEAQKEICGDRAALMAVGLTPTTFAYPFGDEDERTHELAAACGYLAARDVGGLRVAESCPRCPPAEALPPARVMAIRTPGSVRKDTTVADLQGLVLAAEEQAHAGPVLLPLVFHQICDGCSPYGIRREDLEAFLSWLAARPPGHAVVLPLGDAVAGWTEPDRPNLLANPSLEADEDGDGIPDCWRRTHFGEHGASWRAISTGEAHHGNSAQEVTVIGYRSGSSRLLSTCVPPVFEGQTLALRAFYKTDAPVLWTAYKVDGAGRLTWWAQSPWLAPSSSWQPTEWRLPPIPAGVATISVGLSIYGDGFLQIDSHTMTEAPP